MKPDIFYLSNFSKTSRKIQGGFIEEFKKTNFGDDYVKGAVCRAEIDLIDLILNKRKLSRSIIRFRRMNRWTYPGQ